MRIDRGIRVLLGARRGAVYDVSRGLCWAADADEIAILKTMAQGKNPDASTLALVQMRKKGWIVPGVPEFHSLTLEPGEQQKKPPQLEHVWLEVTNSCNLKCQHCYANSGPDADRRSELNEDQWIGVVDDALAYGVNKLTFIGGEPTIRIDLVDRLASHARRKDPNVTLRMFSNLSIERLRDRTLDVVSRHGIEFGTALYGIDPTSHDRMTTHKGSWKNTVSAIRECVDREIDVFVGMYINFNSIDTVGDHEEWLRQLGVRRFQVLAPSQVGRGSIVHWSRMPVANKLPGTLTFSEHQWRVARTAHNCYFDHLAVFPDGNTAPCIMTRSVSYGNVAEIGIDRVLDSAEYREMAGLSKDRIPGCSECEYRYACFDCRPDAMGATNDLRKKPNCGYDPRLGLGEHLVEEH